jgi:hypothetical protein
VDQRLFAPSHSISQRTTSFIASYRQGIHQMPFCHLITLISNAHLCSQPRHPEKDALTRPHSAWWTLQKDQNFHQDIPGTIANLAISPSPSTPLASRLAALSGVAGKASNPGYPLFTMSRIDLHRARPVQKLVLLHMDVTAAFDPRDRQRMVEPDGIEPTT